MRAYRDLIVWKKSMDLVKEIYKLVKMLPQEERFALSDQMRRAAVSIPSNIAEGYGRNTTKDYARFLGIARGSIYELQTQIHICIMLNFISEQDANAAFELSDEVSRIIFVLIERLTAKMNRNNPSIS